MQEWILVTSGPTRAYFDRIRYIANTSSGALGREIVEALAGSGCTVSHIFGAGSQHSTSWPDLIDNIEIETVDDLITAVETVCSDKKIAAVVHAMAVLDYQPETRLAEKKKSGQYSWTLTLKRTPKVTPIIRSLLPDAAVIGFKLESGVTESELIDRAVESLEKYHIDAVVANDLEKVGPDRHEALIIGKNGAVLKRCESKREIAAAVRDIIHDLTGLSEKR